MRTLPIRCVCVELKPVSMRALLFKGIPVVDLYPVSGTNHKLALTYRCDSSDRVAIDSAVFGSCLVHANLRHAPIDVRESI